MFSPPIEHFVSLKISASCIMIPFEGSLLEDAAHSKFVRMSTVDPEGLAHSHLESLNQSALIRLFIVNPIHLFLLNSID
jgi:hypothetical protein